MIDKVVDQEHCTGCMACQHFCAINAIKTKIGSDGFWYPTVNYSQCINCERCLKICPVYQNEKVIRENIKKNIETEAYTAYNKDDFIRIQSSSGGVFDALANIVISRKGIVYGAVFDEKYMVHHMGIEDKDELYKLRGSKYTQSRLENVYEEIKNYLRNQRLVMFVGTSCQVEGLRAFLKYETECLLCVDLICLGIPSPGIWEKYVQRYLKPEKLTGLNFKSKHFGWNRFSIEKKYGNKTKYTIGEYCLFMQGFFKGLYIRKSCFNCLYKNLNRGSDITLADSWGIDTFAPDMNDNKGCSTVLLHTNKGKSFYEAAARFLVDRKVPVSEVLRFNPNAVNCVKDNPRRSFFFWMVNHGLFSLAMIIMCNNFKNQSNFYIKLAIKKILGKR